MSIFYWRAGYRNSRMGNWACTLRSFLADPTAEMHRKWGSLPNFLVLCSSSSFPWAGISLQWAGSTGPLANQSRWDTVTVWSPCHSSKTGQAHPQLPGPITQTKCGPASLILGRNIPFSGYVWLASPTQSHWAFPYPFHATALSAEQGPGLRNLPKWKRHQQKVLVWVSFSV